MRLQRYGRDIAHPKTERFR